MNDIRVGLNIETQITNYENSLKNLQTELSKLRLPDGLKNQFVGIFTDAESEFKKLKQLTASGQLTPVNEKQVEASFAKIDDLYRALVKKMKSSGLSTAMLEKDAKALETVGKSITKYEKEISKTQKEYDDLIKKIQTLTNAQELRAEATRKEEEATKKQIDTEREALKAKKDKLEAELEAKKAEFAADPEKGGGKDKTRGWTSTNQYKEKAAEIKEVEAQLDALKDKERQAQEASQQAAEQYKKDSDAIKKLEINAEAAKKVLDKLKSDTLDAIKKDLSSSDIKWDSFGIKIEDIKSVEDLKAAYEQLKQTAGEETAREFAKMSGLLEESSNGFNDLAKSVSNAIEEFRGLKGAQREVTRMTQNILRFFSIDNAVRLFKRAIRSAYNTIKDLDKVMTETAVVTEFSVGDMWSQLPEYTKRANELGVSIHSAYEAATIYYQQGLKTNEVMAVSNATLKMARIAGLEAAEATDRMTNALRGFNMEITETNADRIADVYSKLAAITASNVDEISTAMTKTASLANSANMSFESTAAFLAQIIETTRESAETAGTALKTVIARFSEVKKLYSEGDLLGTDEEGQEIDVNKVSTALRTAGINLNEFLTGAKGLDEVFMELASKWDTLSIVQQRYIATMAAGSRQQSRFIALMSNYARTQQLVEAATNADGAAQKQYEKTLESLETKLARLKNAWDEFTMGLANSNIVKAAIDLLTTLLTVLNKITSVGNDTISTVTKLVAAFSGFFLLKNKIPGMITSILKVFSPEAAARFTEKTKEADKKLVNFGKDLKTVDKISLGVAAGLTVLGGILSKIGKETDNKALEQFGNSLSAIGAIAGVTILILKSLKVELMGPVGIIFGIVTLAAGLIAAGKAWGWFDSAAEKAGKKLDESSKKLQEAVQNYENVKNILQEINNETSDLNHIIEGTEEWASAVNNLNSQYLKLLETYPELVEYIGLNDKGYFEVTDVAGFSKAMTKISDELVEDRITNSRNQYQYDIATTNDLASKLAEKTGISDAFKQFAQDVASGKIYISESNKRQVMTQFLGRAPTAQEATISIEEIKEYGTALNNLTTASQTYATNLAVYSKQLSSTNLTKDQEKYYDKYFLTQGFKDLQSQKESEGIALTNEEAVNAAKAFADAINKSPELQSFYNKNITGADLQKLQYSDIFKNVGISEEDFLNRLAVPKEVYKKVSQFFGSDFANALTTDAGQLALDLRQKKADINKEGQSGFFEKGRVIDSALNIAKNLAPEFQAGFLEAFSGLNLDHLNLSELEDFPLLLSELGINVEGSEDAIQGMIDKLKELEAANREINFDSVNSLLEELNGRKSNERNWSKEQYDQWRNLGVTKGWVQTGEDQYTYTGSQEAMQTALQVESNAKGEGLDYNKYAGESNWATLQASSTDSAAVKRITAEAAAYEEAQDELEAYNKALGDTEAEQKALKNLQFATEVAKWTDKIKQLDGTLKEDVDQLGNFKEGTSEYDNQLALMSTHINEVFGTELSADFLKTGDNLDLLTKALDGDQEAWEDLLINIDKASVESSEFANQFGLDANTVASISNQLDNIEFEVDGSADMSEVVRSLIDAGLTAEEIAEYLEKLSYTNIQFEAKVDKDGFLTEFKSATAYKAPILGSNASNTFGGGGGSSGGGGGSNKSWKNPYDELYNLTEQINEALRDREKLEREYDRILKNRFSTAEELRNNSLEEIANLRREIYLQQQLLSGRRSQLANVANELYETEGGYKSYAEMGVTKYASYDENTGVITIDWAAIDKVTDTEEGGAIEAYISRLEELQGQIEDTHDTIEEMQDTIDEIKERGKSEYLDFEDRVYDALIKRDQKVIDDYQAMSDSIKDSNDRIIDQLQESIDLERQIRDNTKTEEDIADKEARLAYLQRDTSGANMLEIMQLQEELDDARQSYEDTLIDQSIEQLQKDNELAAEQRQHQIDLMQAQLQADIDSGAYWPKVYAMIKEAYGENGELDINSDLVKLLQETDEFGALSKFGQMNWAQEIAQAWIAAQEGLGNWFVQKAEDSGTAELTNGTTLTYNKKKKVWKDKDGNIYTDLAWDAATGKFTAVQQMPEAATVTTGSTSGTNKPTGGSGGSSGETYQQQQQHTTEFHASADYDGDITHSDYDLGTSGVTVEYQQYDSQYHYKIITDKNGRKSGSKELHTFSNKVCTKCGYKMSLLPEEILQTESTLINQGNDYHGPTFGKPSTQTSIGSGGLSSDINMIKKHFATGGLADFTGLAWLDGSKSSPELVLNPRDTENFITLKNILAQSLERGMGSSLGGDNYFDIDISVDELGSDYDVDKLAERLKTQIYQDSAYRNVNTINFIR